MDKRPIGVFDSGVGGLTVLKKIAKALPHEDLIYLGDTARVPYGTRSKETIRKFAQEDVNFLLTKNVKCIVIACHTVSSVAAIQNGSTAPVPIINATTPTLNFLKDAKRKRIAVIGTRGTIASGVYKKGLRKTKVIEQECPLLVPIIEEGERGEDLESAIRLYLSNIKKGKQDSVVLACKH